MHRACWLAQGLCEYDLLILKLHVGSLDSIVWWWIKRCIWYVV